MTEDYEDQDEYLLPTYDRLPVRFTRGEGVYLYDENDNQYVDVLAGIAVNVLGYRHPYLVEAGREAVSTIHHVSNLFPIEPQRQLAERLNDFVFDSRAFFCNSGTEAVEAGIKFARKYSYRFGNDGREVLSFRNSFHGRTLGSLAATGQQKYQEGFGPLPEGYVLADYNDVESLRSRMNSDVCLVIVEVIQGEGGVLPADESFLRELREICDREGALLMFDEIQTGIGRTGNFLAAQHYGVQPDLVSLAKGLGGGYPIGALLVRDSLQDGLQHGDHASTFGGNPFVTKMALTVLDAIESEELPENVRRRGEQFLAGLESLTEKYDPLHSPRGKGLMIGVSLDEEYEASDIMREGLDHGLIMGIAGGNALRFVPPLILDGPEVEEALNRLDKTLNASLG